MGTRESETSKKLERWGNLGVCSEAGDVLEPWIAAAEMDLKLHEQHMNIPISPCLIEELSAAQGHVSLPLSWRLSSHHAPLREHSTMSHDDE